MKPLFPVPLIGAETAEVESFPSYIHRCAVAHGVNVGQLLRHVDHNVRAENEWQSWRSDWPKLPNHVLVSEMVRPSRVTSMLVEFMEWSTQQSLKQSTFWFMNGVLGRSADEVSNTLRWCPECFRDMNETGDEPYIKLIWHFSAVTECPIHGSPFLTKCPKCGQNQDGYVRKKPIYICSACNHHLAFRTKPLHPNDIVNSWQRQGTDLLTLIDDLASLETLVLPLDGVKRSLNHIYDHYWVEARENDLYSIIGRTPFHAMLRGDRAVSLKVARRLAYCLGLSLFQLMSGQAHQTSAVLNSNWICHLAPVFLTPKQKQPKNHQAVIVQISEIRRNSPFPLPLSRIAKLAEVSVGYLAYRYPNLVRDIVKVHSRYAKQERQKTIQNAQAAAMQFFVEEKFKTEQLSRKYAYRVLREETGLPKFVLRQAIQEAYMALNG